MSRGEMDMVESSRFETPREVAMAASEAPTPDGGRWAHRVAVLAVVLNGAIFGFFYAWVCSTMWGLDAADPRVAIEAMQEMNASVRNAVFFPAFFLTPVALGAAGALYRHSGRSAAARWFVAAAVVYLVGGLLITRGVNVPMNEDLAATEVPTTVSAAQVVWDDYSGRWQRWNVVRTVASGVAFVLAVNGLRRR